MGLFNKFRKSNASRKENQTFVDIMKADMSGFSGDIYQNELVKACIRTHAIHTSKASAKVFRRVDGKIMQDEINKRMERMLNYTPNPYMNGRDFLYRCRALCELNGMVLIHIDKDYSGTPLGYYPINYNSIFALVDNDKMLIGFRCGVNGKTIDFPLNNLAVIRRDWSGDDYFGSNNSALYSALSMVTISDKGIKNAISQTANLRGILKNTKAMIASEDSKKSRDDFVADYLNLENNSGIAALDATQDFTPIDLKPSTANIAQMELFEKRIKRYFGTNDNIIMNSFTPDQWSGYYEGEIEPFLISLSLELTNKSFTRGERGHGNEIIYESNRLQYASANTKLALSKLIDRGIMTINEFREVLSLSAVEGGDERYIRKEYTETGNLDKPSDGADATDENTDNGGEDDGV